VTAAKSLPFFGSFVADAGEKASILFPLFLACDAIKRKQFAHTRKNNNCSEKKEEKKKKKKQFTPLIPNCNLGSGFVKHTGSPREAQSHSMYTLNQHL